MKNLMAVNVFEPQDNICHKEAHLILSESPPSFEMESQITTVQIFHHQIETFFTLKSSLNADDEGVFQLP